MFLIIVNVLGHPKGVGGLTSSVGVVWMFSGMTHCIESELVYSQLLEKLYLGTRQVKVNILITVPFLPQVATFSQVEWGYQG